MAQRAYYMNGESSFPDISRTLQSMQRRDTGTRPSASGTDLCGWPLFTLARARTALLEAHVQPHPRSYCQSPEPSLSRIRALGQ